MAQNVRAVIKRSGRLHGCWADGEEPTAAEAADAVTAFNALKRSLFGTLIGPRLGPRRVVGAAAQAESGGEYLVATGPFTLTAPAAARSGARFGVADAGLSFATAPCTIHAVGALINGAPIDLVLNTAGANRRFWCRGDTGDWVIEADSPGLDSPIEFPDPLIAGLPAMLALAIAAEYGADIRADVAAAAQVGRAAFARSYARRGRNQLDAPIGLGG